MYSSADIVGDAENRAVAIALADREKYLPFLIAAEKFAADNELFVSATRLLLGTAPPLDTFQYDFYSGRALQHARALAIAMYNVDPEGLGHYTTMITKVADLSFVVSVDGRDMFTVTALPVHRGVKTADVVMPTLCPGRAAKLECFGPELQLLRVYATLCDPSRADEWGPSLVTEASLRTLFHKEIRSKVSDAVREVSGGSDRRRAAAAMLIKDYAGQSGRVLIFKDGRRLQVITSVPLAKEGEAIAALLRGAGLESQWSINDPKIPVDIRLRRMTVSIIEEGRREPIMYVYNSGEYELVPFTKATAALAVGTPFVQMRFCLVEIWVMLVLMRMSSVNPKYARGVILESVGAFEEAEKAYQAALKSGGERAAEQLLPSANYYGRFEDAGLAAKRAAAGGRFHPPFMPALSRGQ